VLYAVSYWSGLREVVMRDVCETLGPLKVRFSMVGNRHDFTIFDYAEDQCRRTS
jgi:hypothetical protein